MRGTREAPDPEPAEAPLWARIETETATFAPRRIAPDRRPPWRLAIAASAGVALVVGLANLGRGGATPRAVAEVSGSSEANATAQLAAIVDVRPPAFGRIESAAGIAPIRLRTPTGRDGAITGATVPVDGALSTYANSVQVALEVDRLHPIGDVVIDTNPDGGLRQDYTPTFHVELALPDPRPIGRLWVVITAYDRAGNQLGTVRRAVLIGAERPA